MDYKHYTNTQIRELNKTNLWLRTPIYTPIDVKEKKPEKGKQEGEQTYILHATGDCDMNGRKYIALPSHCNHNDSKIKKIYNLL